MSTIANLCRFLENFAPINLAEEWDNVGLLVGDRTAEVQRVMTCLTLTPSAVAEAVRQRAELVVVHHPLPFKPVARITTDTTTGRILLDLIRAGVAVYSPHTALDSAADGINQHWARKLELTGIAPLIPALGDNAGLGSGRHGRLSSPLSLKDLAERVKSSLGVAQLQVVGNLDQPIERVAVGCGSAGSLLSAACSACCDVFVTGEANLHTCYEAEATGIALILVGHYASERFHLEYLAAMIQQEFPRLEVWPSRDERDPVAWL